MPLYRREVLIALLGAPLASSLGLAAGCDDDAPSAPHATGSLLGPAVAVGHALRDGSFGDDAFRGAPERRVRVAVLGGGPAGLAAGFRLARRGVDDFVVLELEPAAGGTSVAGASEVTPYPWGAHYVPVPMATNERFVALLREMGVVTGVRDDGELEIAEEALVRAPQERVFHRGFWYEGVYPYAGASPSDLDDLRRFRAIVDRYVAMRDGEGRRAFAIPIARGSDDPDVMELDRVTARAWLEREGLRSERLAWLLEHACKDDYGLSLDDASAWAALFYYAARTPAPGRETMDLITWPEGNGALVRHMASAIGRRLETDRAVVRVVPTEGGVRVHTIDARSRRAEIVVAERVIVAMPQLVAKRIVEPVRQRGDHDDWAQYGAWMVANLHLASRPRESPGYPPCWDNVLHGSPSLGYVTATHQRGREVGPTVWTYYLPLVGDPRAARQKLLDATWDEWREVIVRDLSRAHPDLARHVERIDVWRWGHAMIQPRVGVMSSASRRAAAAAIGRVHFAHSDLSGVALFEEAFDHGARAADEIAAALRDGGSIATPSEGVAGAPT